MVPDAEGDRGVAVVGDADANGRTRIRPRARLQFEQAAVRERAFLRRAREGLVLEVPVRAVQGRAVTPGDDPALRE